MMKSAIQLAVLASVLVLCSLSYAQDIFMASYNGDVETVKRLIRQNPELVNSRNSMGRFPLEMTAQTGQVEIVWFLIERAPMSR